MRLDQFPSARAPRPLYARPPRRPRRWLRLGLRLAATLALLVVVLVGALALMIASGPLDIKAIRDRIVTAAEARLGPDYKVTVAGSSIDVDPVLGLVVQIDEITVRDSSRNIVAHVPAVRLAVDPISFLRLRVDITNLEISEPEVSLVRAADGKIFLGTSDTVLGRESPAKATELATAPRSPDAEAADAALTRVNGGFPNLFSALRILDASLEPAIDAVLARNFQRLSIDAATLQIWDSKKQQNRVFPHSDIVLTADSQTGSIKTNFSTSGYSGRWGVVAERSLNAETHERTLSASFSQLTLADIEPNFGRPESLLTSDIPLYGRATVVLGDNGNVKDASVRIDLGAGTIVSGFGKDTILLDEATIRLHWDVLKRTLVLEPSTFFFGDTRGMLSGEIKPMTEASDGRYSFSFESNNSVLSARDANAPAIIADRIALVGKADFPGQRIDITEAGITTQQGSVTAAGSLGLDGPTPSLAMAASFTPMSVATLKQIWPPILAGPARNWVMQHVIDGQVEAGRFEAAIPGGVLWTGERVTMPEDYMRLDAKIDNVSFNTVGTIPPLTGVSGNAVVAGSTFGVDMDKGQITAPSGKVLQITAGAFAVPNTALPTPRGQVEMQFEGDVGAMAEIANSEPMLAMERQNINPTDLSGDGRASLSIKMPMKPGLLPSDIDWHVSLQTTGLASVAPIEGKTIKNGAFTMTADADEVTIKGKATINGVPASIDLAQPLGDRDGNGDLEGGRRQVKLVLDADARKRLGIGLDNVLGGTVGADVTELSGDRKGQHYELDLKQARLVLQAVGWSKGVGVPAKLSFDLLPKDDGFAVENMVLTGDGFGVRGRAELDAKYSLVSADLEKVALRKGDQISVKLSQKGNGYAIVARGSSFDARGLIAQYKTSGTSPNDDAADLSVDANIDNLTGFGQVVLTGANINVRSQGGVLGKVTLEGMLPHGGVTMDFADTGDAAKLNLQSADAGSLIGFIDLYQRISGGHLALTGSRRGARGAFVGVLDVNDFAIVNEASMRQLVSASTGTGQNTASNGINPDNVPFSRMRLDYTKRGSVVVIEDAVLRGASAGATLNGVLDLARQKVSMVGTYLPSYAFNNLFGRLPLIGLALGGGSKGGLFGVTFKVEGPMNGPDLTVNPLSLITPGIFRKIFEFPLN